MAAEYRTFTITTPANTPIANPQVTSIAMPARVVQSFSVLVPTGVNGALGFGFGAAGQMIIPYNGGWIVAAGETVPLPVSDQITSGAWQCFTYNVSTSYPHTIYVRVALNLPQPSSGLIVPNTAAIAALTSNTAV